MNCHSNILVKINKFNYKRDMNMKSKALSRSLNALQDNFPTIILPNHHSKQSLFDYLQNITSQLLPSNNIKTVIQKMKNASDAQQYRIQKSILEMQSQTSFTFIEEICYQANSTGIIGQRQMFNIRNQVDGSSIVDDVWWNAEKKMEEIQYFMD